MKNPKTRSFCATVAAAAANCPRPAPMSCGCAVFYYTGNVFVKNMEGYKTIKLFYGSVCELLKEILIKPSKGNTVGAN